VNLANEAKRETDAGGSAEDRVPWGPVTVVARRLFALGRPVVGLVPVHTERSLPRLTAALALALRNVSARRVAAVVRDETAARSPGWTPRTDAGPGRPEAYRLIGTTEGAALFSLTLSSDPIVAAFGVERTVADLGRHFPFLLLDLTGIYPENTAVLDAVHGVFAVARTYRTRERDLRTFMARTPAPQLLGAMLLDP
jgi:hypothetical protein